MIKKIQKLATNAFKFLSYAAFYAYLFLGVYMIYNVVKKNVRSLEDIMDSETATILGTGLTMLATALLLVDTMNRFFKKYKIKKRVE